MLGWVGGRRPITLDTTMSSLNSFDTILPSGATVHPIHPVSRSS